jgi:hypothetical protein
MKTELTPNLKLIHIEENNVQDNELIAVCIFFSFYGEEGTAYLTIDKLDSKWSSFALVESCSDLHESFNEQLEKNWEGIVKAVKSYHEEWKTEMAEFD